MSTPVLGDYNCEDVVLTLKGIKTDVDIVPSDYGPEMRVSFGARARAETTEGQGGAAVINHLHTRVTDMAVHVMMTDPAHALLDAADKARERYNFTVVDNSGTGKVSGVCWLRESAAWERGRVSGEVVYNFQAWVQDMQHGQTAIIA